MTTTTRRRRMTAEEYFGQDPQARLLEDRNSLRRAMLGWRRRVKRWDDMLYPQLTDNSPPTADVKSKTELERENRARFISNTIITGSNNIINRFELGDPIFEVGLETEPDKETQKQAAMVERFLHGIVNSLDAAVVRARMGTGWKRLVYVNAIMPA